MIVVAVVSLVMLVVAGMAGKRKKSGFVVDKGGSGGADGGVGAGANAGGVTDDLGQQGRWCRNGEGEASGRHEAEREECREKHDVFLFWRPRS